MGRQMLWSWLLVPLGLYGLLIAGLWWRQEALLFLPQRLAADHRFNLGPDVVETWVDVPGARLHALHLKLPQPRGVVFYLHGNAGNLQSWFINPDFYRRANIDLFMIDFRGYGKSTGRIQSQAQLLDDTRAAWASVQAQYAGQRRVIYGRSLGTGLAAVLAAEIQPELTVLVSPYQSMLAMAKLHYPFVPSAVLRYPLRTDEVIGRIKTPLLLVHGEVDALIPAQHSVALKALAPQAELLLLPGVGHGDIQDSKRYLDTLARAYTAP